MGLTEEQKNKRAAATKEIETFDSEKEDDYVFISYKSDDWEVVLDKVVRYMVDNYGLRVYFDKNFDRDNDSWVKNMKKAITTRKCRAVLAFVSKKYMVSYACVMELLTARSIMTYMCYDDEHKKLPIIPIIVDHSKDVRAATSKSGKEVVIKEWKDYLELLENTKKSPWVQDNQKLMFWLEQLAENQELTEERLSSVAEIILGEGHQRHFTENSLESDFFDNLREAIGKCSEDVFAPSLIKKKTTTPADADAASGESVKKGTVNPEEKAVRASGTEKEDRLTGRNEISTTHLKYWEGFRAYAEKKGLDDRLRFPEAADHNWYAIRLGSAIFRIECSVNTSKDILRAAFFVKNAPDRFARLQQAQTAIEAAIGNAGEIVWDGKSQAANVSIFISRKGKSTEEQYEWFCQAVEKLYAAVSPYLGQ